MSNLFDALDRSTAFSKFKIDDLLFVEYTCDPGGPRTKIWSHANYFTYVVSGRMTLKTPNDSFEIRAGESYFIKKGAFIIPQFFEEVFCDMIIFITDSFICEVINKHQIKISTSFSKENDKTIIPLNLDQSLIQYYQSLFSYFRGQKPPSEILLKLKFEELIVNILTNTHNPELSSHFAFLLRNQHPSLPDIMEHNFNANLSMAEFARLSARSLSTFRRDFYKIYHTTPGVWLREKRLQYSRHLIGTSNNSIGDIAYESGFRNRTHFIRCFKERFQCTPHEYRQNS